MTNKEFLFNISNGELTNEVISFATEQLKKIIQKEDTRKAASETTRKRVLELFENEPKTASEIALSAPQEYLFTTQKVSAACRVLVERGLLERIEPTKRNTPVQYRRVNSEEE